MVVLFTVAFFGNLILPEFHDVFNGFETDLPLSTSIVMSSYKGWWLLPIIMLVVLIDLFRRGSGVSLDYIKIIKTIGVVGIFLALFIAIFSTYAVYAPVFAKS